MCAVLLMVREPDTPESRKAKLEESSKLQQAWKMPCKDEAETFDPAKLPPGTECDPVRITKTAGSPRATADEHTFLRTIGQTVNFPVTGKALTEVSYKRVVFAGASEKTFDEGTKTFTSDLNPVSVSPDNDNRVYKVPSAASLVPGVGLH